MSVKKVKQFLIIEPFYGGSHKILIDNLISEMDSEEFDLVTMSAKKWHWRARFCALYISTAIPKNQKYKILFCSSVLPLAELIALRQDLSGLLKVVYFNENQLDYPVRQTKKRDFQFGYNEILSCLVADKVLFNSHYNMTSFLGKIDAHLKIQPDYVTKSSQHPVQDKCCVVYFPMNLKSIDKFFEDPDYDLGPLLLTKTEGYLHIVWPHRWEFDKNPSTFVKIMKKMKQRNLNFKLSILGQSFKEVPEEFQTISNLFKDNLLYFGFLEDKREYYHVLKYADVVISTATHEYFGVAVMEAVYCKCIPVVPKRLAYEELYDECVQELYNTEDELLEILTTMCNKKRTNEFIHKDYSPIALGFESKKWYSHVIDIINTEMKRKFLRENPDQQVPESV